MNRFGQTFAAMLAMHLAPSANATDYLKDIKPLLKARCYSCHGAVKQKQGLRLDTAAHIRQGSKNGKVITPGKPAQSKLLAKITAADVVVFAELYWTPAQLLQVPGAR